MSADPLDVIKAKLGDLTDEQREELMGKICSNVEDVCKAVGDRLPYMIAEAEAKETSAYCRMLMGEKGGAL